MGEIKEKLYSVSAKGAFPLAPIHSDDRAIIAYKVGENVLNDWEKDWEKRDMDPERCTCVQYRYDTYNIDGDCSKEK